MISNNMIITNPTNKLDNTEDVNGVVESTINSIEHNTNIPIKKKKKKRSWKSKMRRLLKSKKTDAQIKEEHRNKIKESLGGGHFNKMVDRL